MSANRLFLVVMLVVVVVMRPSLVSAQSSRIDLPIVVGQKVTITTDDGKVNDGTVRTLTPASVVLSNGNGDVSLAVLNVTRIRVADSLWDGAANGAVFLGVPLTLLVALSCQHSSWLRGTCLDGRPGYSRSARPIVKTAIVTGGIGALIGIVTDSLSQKTVYKSEGRSRAVSLRPFVSAAGKGIGAQVRW